MQSWIFLFVEGTMYVSYWQQMFECMDRSDLLNGFVPDSLNGNGMEDMCKTTTCTLDPKSEEVTTPPHISSRKEQILEDLQNFSGNPKSIVVSGKIAYTQSEPNLSTMLTAHQQQETDPIGLLSRLDLFEPQVLNNKKDSEDLTNFSNGQSVHATKSIPVMSSSVAVSTTLPKEQEEELLFGEKLISRSQKAESAHGGNNSFPGSSSSRGLSFFLFITTTHVLQCRPVFWGLNIFQVWIHRLVV